MSVLIGDGLVRHGLRKGAGEDADPRSVLGPHTGRPIRARGRAGETRRPPTRARVVAGRGPLRVAFCARRRTLVRWPWLTGLALAVCAAITGLGLLANGLAAAGVPTETTTVSVAPGETLSDLAARFAPASEPGAVVERIKSLNGLADAVVMPGVPLVVPTQPGIPAG